MTITDCILVDGLLDLKEPSEGLQSIFENEVPVDLLLEVLWQIPQEQLLVHRV